MRVLLLSLLACRGTAADETTCCVDYYGPYAPGGVWLVTGPEILAGEPGIPFVPPWSECGDSVVAPGDVDGHGAPDLGVLCEQAGLAMFSAGGELLTTIGPPGREVSALGDLDADGLPEVGFSGPSGTWGTIARTGQDDAGQLQLLGTPRWVANDAPRPAGDLDGDGVADWLVTAMATVVGDDLAVTGTTVARSGTDLSTDAPIAVLDAPLVRLDTPRELAHATARGIGDVNGDGRDDLAVIPDPWSGFSDEADGARGRVALYTGTGDSVAFLPYLTGGAPNRSGVVRAVGLGDPDGDGRADLAVLLDTFSSSDDHTTVLAVVPGAAVPTFGPLDVAPWALAAGEGSSDLAACDLDGDGRPELLTDAGIWAGADLLVPGTAARWPGVPFPVACLGDVDGDGTEDIARGDHSLRAE